MPIKKFNQGRYPAEWKDLALLIKESNFYICQSCQTQCLQPGDDRTTLTRAECARRTLTIAHYDNEYDAPAVFLACICVRCHLQHDAPFRPQARERNLRIVRREAGQLEIFQEERTAV